MSYITHFAFILLLHEIATNVRLKDVEEAQQRIVSLIRKLEESGEVIINKGGDEGDIIV